MTDTATAIFAAYDAWLALIKTALPTLDANGAIYDGDTGSYTTSTDFVVVGANDLTANGDRTAVDNGQQQFVSMPAGPRDEQFTLYAILVSWIGNKDLADCRTRARANLNAIATAQRADLTLGGALPQPSWSGISVQSAAQRESPQGSSLHVPFALDCRCRI